jgi:hypothetical protein
MGLSAQSVVWGCGVCAADVEYTLCVTYIQRLQHVMLNDLGLLYA